MSEIAEQLKRRSMRFALDVCALIKGLPWQEPGPTVKRQLARASTGVAFNYRSCCRARSHAEFTSRIAVVSEEADESYGWLEFIEAAGLLRGKELMRLIHEGDELAAIFSATLGTARYNQRNQTGPAVTKDA
jgi:four helix bundle protein